MNMNISEVTTPTLEQKVNHLSSMKHWDLDEVETFNCKYLYQLTLKDKVELYLENPCMTGTPPSKKFIKEIGEENIAQVMNDVFLDEYYGVA